MESQPQVPWYVGAAVGSAIAVCGFALAFSGSDVTFLTPNLKFAIGAVNAALGVFAVYLNIKKPSA